MPTLLQNFANCLLNPELDTVIRSLDQIVAEYFLEVRMQTNRNDEIQFEQLVIKY